MRPSDFAGVDPVITRTTEALRKLRRHRRRHYRRIFGPYGQFVLALAQMQTNHDAWLKHLEGDAKPSAPEMPKESQT